MTKLKAGDVRKKGDVYLRKLPQNELIDGSEHPGMERAVRLIGHVILPSDLIADDFFRPENFLTK